MEQYNQQIQPEATQASVPEEIHPVAAAFGGDIGQALEQGGDKVASRIENLSMHLARMNYYRQRLKRDRCALTLNDMLSPFVESTSLCRSRSLTSWNFWYETQAEYSPETSSLIECGERITLVTRKHLTFTSSVYEQKSRLTPRTQFIFIQFSAWDTSSTSSLITSGS